MPLPADSLDKLESQARGLGAPLVVVEMQGWRGRYAPHLDQVREGLAVSVILSAPGPSDSRYRVEHLDYLPAHDQVSARAAIETARLLAMRLGVPLYPAAQPAGAVGPAISQIPAFSTPRWLARQGPSPERAWPATWALTRWQADGTRAREAGERRVTASRGAEVLHELEKDLTTGLPLPFLFLGETRDFPSRMAWYHRHFYPHTEPLRDTLRGLAFRGTPLSAIVSSRTAEVDTVLERMLLVEEAFLVNLEELDAVGAFCRGQLPAAALDEALGGAIQGQKTRWSLPLRFREAHAQGQSIGPLMQEVYAMIGGPLGLIEALREAFGVSLKAGKMLVSTACGGDQDEQLSAILEEELRAIAAGERERRQARWVSSSR